MWQGLQTEFGAVTYAGGMALNSENNIVYITGQVGAYNCFVGAVQLGEDDKMTFVSKQILESAICQNLGVDKHSGLLLLATAEEGGLFTDLRSNGTNKATQYGLVAPLTFLGDGIEAFLHQGILLHDDVVQYPKSIVFDPNHDDFAYIASMHSDSPTENIHTTIDAEPNFTLLRKYGSSYFLMIQRIMFDEKHALQKGSWRKEYAVLPINGEVPDVIISGMMYVGNSLVVIGYTKGSGNAFGEATNGLTSGFISKFDTETGMESGNAKRISYSNSEDTLLFGGCVANPNSDSLYVTTKSGTSVKVTKVNPATLETIWRSDISVTDEADGVKCAIDQSEGVVYFAGVIKNGGTLLDDNDRTTKSLGQDDIFIVQIDAATGNTNWMKQFGTSDFDRLADMKVVPSKGVLLFGDSFGNLMAPSTKKSEIWLVQVTMDGVVPKTNEEDSSLNNNGGYVQVSQPILVGADDNDGSTTGGTQPTPTPAPTPSLSNNDGAVNDIILSPSTKGESHGAEVFFWLVVIVVLAVVIHAVLKSRRDREMVTERALVFSHLQSFEPEDIDVRNSATGGWHGTYVGKLAQGRSNSHSSLVADSLFVDYDLGSPKEPIRAPRLKFVIGDDEDDDTLPQSPDEPLGNSNDGEDNMDDVNIQIKNSHDYDDYDDAKADTDKPWGKEIV
jgi:hypothetical protein